MMKSKNVLKDISISISSPSKNNNQEQVLNGGNSHADSDSTKKVSLFNKFALID